MGALLVWLAVIAGSIYYLGKQPRFSRRTGEFAVNARSKKHILQATVSNNLLRYDNVNVRGVEVEFPVKFPHIVIDSHDNDRWYRGMLFRPVESERFELEGDFYKSFSVYSPALSRNGALAILTPDVMRLIMDEGKDYDYELHRTRLTVMTPDNVQSIGMEKLIAFTEKLSQQIAEQVIGRSNDGRLPILKMETHEAFKMKRMSFDMHTTVFVAGGFFIAFFVFLAIIGVWYRDHNGDTGWLASNLTQFAGILLLVILLFVLSVKSNKKS